MEMTGEAWGPALNFLSLEKSNNFKIILQVKWGFIWTPAIDDGVSKDKVGTTFAGSKGPFLLHIMQELEYNP